MEEKSQAECIHFSIKQIGENMRFTVLGANIPRASEETIQALIDLGVIYLGDDGEFHVNENIPTQTAKSE